ILIEAHSTNTGENIAFTKRLLTEKGLNPHSFIIVQKPYMERRSYATFRKLWPEKDLIVTSPQVSFQSYLEEYANRSLSVDDVVSIMVGDLQRIRLYPSLGFQIEQEIPAEVWSAFELLVRAGYDKYLIQPSV
ncbi:MAG TPA: YdcF family protein, partial [Pyrinomonadaceae bacterium]|nr:YdcF family protein [Pyrinomonadaceae bacterium]